LSGEARKKKVARDWLSTVVYVILFVFGLIEYGQSRNWFKSVIGGDWELGFFEGVIVAIFVFALIRKYGSDIDDIVSGLRERGNQRRDRLQKEEHQKDTQDQHPFLEYE
jgi:hypothetical protein